MSNYWHRFLHIEKKLKEFSTHVDFDIRNEKTFSIEIMNLYLTICSEIEAVYKACVNNNQTHINFNDFRQHYNNASQADGLNYLKKKIKIKYTSLDFEPFLDIQDLNKSISWWKHHNELKHNRENNIHLANLGNLLNAASALFILNLVYRFVNQNKILIYPIPEIFDAEGFLVSIHSAGGGLLYTNRDCISRFTPETPYDD